MSKEKRMEKRIEKRKALLFFALLVCASIWKKETEGHLKLYFQNDQKEINGAEWVGCGLDGIKKQKQKKCDQ